MKRLIIFPLLFSTLSMSFTTFASFYKAKVVLQGSDKQAESEAKKEGLKEVLVRVSGKAKTLALPEIEANFPKASQFLNQVFYENSGEKRVANYVYDNRKILDLLKKAKASYWDEERPSVLFWLADINENQIIWSQYASPIIDELRAAGVRRGLPVFIPTGSVEDRVNIDLADLLSNFIGSIKQASMKYQPTGVVVAKIDGNSLNWTFFPSIEQMEEIPSITGQEKSLSLDAIDQMVDELTEYYAEELAISMELGEAKPYFFELVGVDSASDYFLAEKLLQQLNSVATVDLKSVVKDTITFTLKIYESVDAFQTELLKFERIQPSPAKSEMQQAELEPVENTAASSSILTDGNKLDSTKQEAEKESLNKDAVKIETLSYLWL